MMTKRSSRVLGLLVACVFALEACGDGEEGKEGPPTCARMCRVFGLAACDEFDEGECIDGCTELAEWGHACASEYRRIIYCVVRAPAIKLVCADGQPVVTGTDCAQESYEYAQCGRLNGGVAGAAGQSGMGGRASAALCSEECPYSGDRVCDDGGPGASYGDCSYGTDCADCGVRVWTAPGEPLCSNECAYRADGRCDDGGPRAQSGRCTYGTDCADCGARATSGSGGGGTGGSGPMEICTDECSLSADGLCDDGGPRADYSVCGLGTDCTDCGPRTVGGAAGTGGGTAEWICSAGYYGSSDGCDCGCGVADPDCQEFGCTAASCSAPACQFCHAADGSSESCDANAWTLIALPDTQYYSLSYPEIFESQTRWIVDNRERLNIQMVMHEGDLVENWNSVAEWNVADATMGLLIDANIPLTATPGDHDHEGQTPDGSTQYFYEYFPETRFNDNPWWGGDYNDNTNQYVLRTISNDDYIFVAVDFCPSPDEIAWANGVLDEHSSRKAIMVTHALIDDDGAYYGASDCSRYQGDTTFIWNDLIRRHDNLQLVLCGHMHLNDGEHHRTVRNTNGVPVHLVLANYQMRELGGNGRLRIMTFVPTRGQIQVQTYSPYTGEFETDEDSQFALPYEMEGAE